MDIRFYYSFLCVYLYHPWKSILYILILFFVIPLYVICVSVILNCTYVMWTRLCIIIIVLLQFHFGFSSLCPFLCCMLSILWTVTYPVALVLWYYDITVAYPCFDLLLKSIPHRAVGASLFWCCCCSRCSRGCVILLFDFRFFFLFFLSSMLVSSCGGLRGHPWRSYVVLSSFRLMFRFDHWYHTYQFCVVVPRKLLSSFVPPRCCSFFLRSMPSTCGVRFFLPTFWHSCWIRKNYRFGGSWSAAGNSRDCHGTFFACWWARASLFVFSYLLSFDLSFVRFGHWLQHRGLTGPIVMIIVFSSDAG